MQAVIDRARFAARVLSEGVSGLLTLLGIASLITGAALPTVVHALRHQRGWLFALAFALVALAAVEGGYRLRDLGEPEWIGPEHFSMLRHQLESCLLMVGNERPIDFGDPQGGRPLHAEAFAAHFPRLSVEIVEWNRAAQAHLDTYDAFLAAVDRHADAVGLDPRFHDSPTLIASAKMRDRAGHVGSGIELHLTSNLRADWPRIAPHMMGNHRNPSSPSVMARLSEPVARFATELPGLPEVARVNDALDEVRRLAPVLRDELLATKTQEQLPAVEGCEICRRNRSG